MNKDLETILASVAEKTLAELAFIFSVSDDQEPMPASAALVASSVEFSGPFSGRLTLAVSANMLSAIAANMLGIDEGDPRPLPDQQRDALKEMTNVVCGNLLPRLAGTQVVFKIEAPDLVEPEAIDGTGGQRPVARTALMLDAGRAEFALFINGEVPALTGR
ncbi:MAG TPA: chemotaxis protein CheX [bacterium]|nr:chemotaxis protein CheX [bacterium]